MKKLLFFLILACTPVTIFCEHEEETVELIEVDDLSELDDLLEDIVNGIEPAPPAPTDEDLRYTLRERLTIFWNLPFEVKWMLIKDHVSRNKIAYGAGATATASATALAIYFIFFRKSQEARAS